MQHYSIEDATSASVNMFASPLNFVQRLLMHVHKMFSSLIVLIRKWLHVACFGLKQLIKDKIKGRDVTMRSQHRLACPKTFCLLLNFPLFTVLWEITPSSMAASLFKYNT